MAKLTLNSTSTGSVSFDAPVTTENTTITVPAADAGMQVMRLETAKTATGTSVDFTGIPSWVKKITVMFNGVSTNGGSGILVQVGNGSITTSGYASSSCAVSILNANSTAAQSSTAGFVLFNSLAAAVRHGTISIMPISGNTYISSHSIGQTPGTGSDNSFGGGSVTLSGTLDRLRLTTVNGTDTFDAGTINILLEGY